MIIVASISAVVLVAPRSSAAEQCGTSAVFDQPLIHHPTPDEAMAAFRQWLLLVGDPVTSDDVLTAAGRDRMRRSSVAMLAASAVIREQSAAEATYATGDAEAPQGTFTVINTPDRGWAVVALNAQLPSEYCAELKRARAE